MTSVTSTAPERAWPGEAPHPSTRRICPTAPGGPPSHQGHTGGHTGGQPFADNQADNQADNPAGQPAPGRWWARFTTPTPNRPTNTHRRLLLALVGVGVGAAVLTGIAVADPTSPDSGLLGVFNLKDSHNISVLQYQMSIDEGGVTDPNTAVIAMFALATWSLYTFVIGFLGWLVDWIIGMDWLSWIIVPLQAMQNALRTNLLTPLGFSSLSTGGAVGFLLLLAGGIGGWHLLRGRRGRGAGEWLMSAVAAAAAVGILASPVALFLGTGAGPAAPLKRAQQVGVSLARVVDGQSLTTTGTGGGEPQFGSVLVDSFIRPAHQIINYGTDIDHDDAKCVTTYDQTLKAGPYTDPSDARDKLGGCDPKLKDQAEAVSYFRIIVLVVVFFQTELLVAVVVCVFAALTMVSVLMLGWSSLKLLIHAPLAIAPGDTREPLVRDLVDIAVGYVYLACNILVLAVIMQLVKAALANGKNLPVVARFVGVEILLWAGIVLLVVNFFHVRKTGRSLAKRLNEKLGWREQTTLGDRARSWAAQPTYGTAATGLAGGYLGAAAGRPGISSGAGRPSPGTATRKGLTGRLAGTGLGAFGSVVNNPTGGILQTRGARLALGGAALGLAAGTGGATLAAKSGIVGFKGAVAGGKLAAAGGKATGHAVTVGAHATRRAAATTVRTADTARTVHRGLRVGAQHATTGRPRLDAVLARTAAGHNHLTWSARQAHSRLAPVERQLQPSDQWEPEVRRAPRVPGPGGHAAPAEPTHPAATIGPPGPTRPVAAPVPARPPTRPAWTRSPDRPPASPPASPSGGPPPPNRPAAPYRPAAAPVQPADPVLSNPDNTDGRR